MVLVDTSVWMRFLADKEPFASELERLLALDSVLAHELIQGELLVGDRGGRARFLAAYASIPLASTVPHSDVIELVKARRLHGRGIGWIDAHLVASALVEGIQLWTADTALAEVAVQLGVSH